jgi:hypothetical protein
MNDRITTVLSRLTQATGLRRTRWAIRARDRRARQPVLVALRAGSPQPVRIVARRS